MQVADALPQCAAHQALQEQPSMQHVHTCALPLSAVVGVTGGLARVGNQQHLRALDALCATIARRDSTAWAQVAKGAGLSKVCQHHLSKTLGCER